jgi:hypothetical protein
MKSSIWLQDYIDLKLLTSGNPILSNEQNEIIFKHEDKWHKNTLVVKVKNGCVYQLFEVKGQATVSFKCWRRLIK